MKVEPDKYPDKAFVDQFIDHIYDLGYLELKDRHKLLNNAMAVIRRSEKVDKKPTLIKEIISKARFPRVTSGSREKAD